MLRLEAERGYERSSPHVVPVKVAEELLGHQVVERNEALDLTSMFGFLQDLAEVEYSEAYFRTRDGTIFRLSRSKEEDNKGELTGPSRDGSDLVTVTFLEDYVAPTRGLAVDMLFIYDGDGTKYTPVVTEIIGVLKNQPSPEEISNISQGKVSTIIEEFEAQVTPGEGK